MKPGLRIRSTGRRAVLASAVLGLLSFGCGLEPRSQLLSNQVPEVTLERPRFVAIGEDGQAVAFAWKGRDPGGRVDHYVFALDPHSVDRVDATWSRTDETAIAIRIPRTITNGRAVVAAARAALEPHVFAVRAVDEAGVMSTPATMALFGTNIAPDVQIVDPVYNPCEGPAVTGTAVQIRWEGHDLDGRITGFKYRLFGARNPDFPEIPNFVAFARADPDSFRRLYAPTFAGWDSVGPEVQSARYTGLVPYGGYLFAVTAFDDAGDYTPVFQETRNVVVFVAYGARPPTICIASPLFGSLCSLTGRDVDLNYEVPAEATIPVTWWASPPPASSIQGYRWVLDPLDPADEKPRTNPSADPNHWTPWSLDATSAELGPFHSRTDDRVEHVLNIQARDIFDRTSTMRIHFTLAHPTHERELLVVDDTRLTPDQLRPDGSYAPPRGRWPSAAELDTFLYAQGNVPWRGYPAGTLSRRGLLATYNFDTLGTRGLPNGVVPLSALDRYRQVVWMTDDIGSTFTGNPLDLLQPITSLRLMSSSFSMSTLSAYVAQGGKLWLCGGGAAYATLGPWQRRTTPPDEFTHADGELVEGRFMYDHAHWRSAVTVRSATVAVLNHPGVLGPTWAGHPSYGRLRAEALVLLPRSPATDPPPPLRTPDAFFYVPFFTAEYLSQPNAIVEDVDPRPNHEQLESTLDTVYVVGGGTATSGAPLMTYYHGSEGGSVVFSGFPIWGFQRTQCAALVDFVLQDIWGLAPRNAQLAGRQR